VIESDGEVPEPTTSAMFVLGLIFLGCKLPISWRK
jgi:hypothetical protein